MARFVDWVGPKALIVWLLLLTALGIFAGGLVELVAGLEFGFVLLVVVVAMTIGWILGALPIRGWLGAVFGFLFGLEFVMVRVGRLSNALIAVVSAMFAFAGQVFAWLWERLLYLASYSVETREFELIPVRVVEWMAVPDAFGVVWSGIGTLLSRAYAWLFALFTGRGTYDPVGTALVWGIGVWICALWAGWHVSRKRPIVGLLPPGFLLSFLLAYTYAPSGILLPFLGVILILLALSGHRERETRWSIANIDFSRDLWGELAMAATGVSLTLVLAAAVLPNFSYRRLADWIDQLTAREEEAPMREVAKSLGVEQQPPTPQPLPVRPAQLLRSTDLPRSHLIGSGAELSRAVAFIVATGEIPPVEFEEFTDPMIWDVVAPRHYWRSLTYDRYFGYGWATSSMGVTEYEAGALYVDPETPNTRLLRQEVRVIRELGGVVYVAGQFVSVDHDYEVSWRPPNEVFAVTIPERVYRADSLLPEYTVEALREAGTDYPDWLLERYLQLPETTPERVRVLARDLTAVLPTPYDRAAAIEAYLREFPYTLNVSRPSGDTDIADYFLFELQEGYCDYYATSMVVLARAAGLPARLVVGYASGQYDINNARYIVTEADAHAWAEVYFPGYGWIEFEPTGGYAPIYRPQEREDTPIWPQRELGPLTTPTPTSDVSSLVARVLLWHWIVAGLAVAMLLVLGRYWIDSVAMLFWRSPVDMATVLYNRLRRAGQKVQVQMHVGDTPYEYGRLLVKRLMEIAAARRDEDLLPPAEDEIPVLIELYVRAWYSPHAIESPERRAALWAWWKLQWRLGLAWLWRKRRTTRPSAPAVDRSTRALQPSQ